RRQDRCQRWCSTKQTPARTGAKVPASGMTVHVLGALAFSVQSSSASRLSAGAFGFLTLFQSVLDYAHCGACETQACFDALFDERDIPVTVYRHAGGRGILATA